MTEASFTFGGKRYSGTVASSTKMEPHYYWFICKDQELIDLLGEDLAFVKKDGTLRAMNYTLAERHPQLFGAIIETILTALGQAKV